MRGNTIRKPILVGLLVAIVVVSAILTWYLLSLRHIARIAPRGERTSVLLLGVDRRTETAHNDAVILLSVSAENAVFLSIPADLRVKLADGTFSTIGDVTVLGGSASVRGVVADFLGIDVPFHIAVDEVALERGIEENGDLALTVDERVVYMDTAVDPPLEMEFREGTHRLDANAVVRLLRGDPGDEARVARQQIVMRAIVDAWMLEPAFRAVQRTARAVHPLLDTNLSVLDLYDVARALRNLDPSQLEMAVVPARRVDVGGVSHLQPMAVETERIVADLIEGLDLLTPTEVSVAVFNGNGIRQMASQAAEYLRERGFPVTRVGNAENFDYATSYVVVLTDESKAWMLRDALPSSVSIVFPESFGEHYQALKDWVPSGTDLILIAGAGMELK